MALLSAAADYLPSSKEVEIENYGLTQPAKTTFPPQPSSTYCISAKRKLNGADDDGPIVFVLE
jgi:hypothetical protein